MIQNRWIFKRFELFPSRIKNACTFLNVRFKNCSDNFHNNHIFLLLLLLQPCLNADHDAVRHFWYVYILTVMSHKPKEKFIISFGLENSLGIFDFDKACIKPVSNARLYISSYKDIITFIENVCLIIKKTDKGKGRSYSHKKQHP